MNIWARLTRARFKKHPVAGVPHPMWCKLIWPVVYRCAEALREVVHVCVTRPQRAAFVSPTRIPVVTGRNFTSRPFKENLAQLYGPRCAIMLVLLFHKYKNPPSLPLSFPCLPSAPPPKLLSHELHQPRCDDDKYVYHCRHGIHVRPHPHQDVPMPNNRSPRSKCDDADGRF